MHITYTARMPTDARSTTTYSSLRAALERAVDDLATDALPVSIVIDDLSFDTELIVSLIDNGVLRALQAEE